MQPKPNPADFTHNGELQQPHYDNAVRAWEKLEAKQKSANLTIYQIREAYCRIRKIDHTIPDDILDLMKDAAIEKVAGAEWENEQKGKEVDLTSPCDLSECSEEVKAEILTAAANACMPVMLHAFISAGIENYTEHQIVNTSDGKRYVLTFQTEASFMKRVNLSAIPEKYSKKY